MFTPLSPQEEAPPNYCSIFPSTYQDIQVFSISLNFQDRLRVIGAPPELVAQIREVILSHWGKIQAERDYYGALEFKLKGYPWSNFEYDSQSVRSRNLMYGLLMCMITNGWNLLQGVDISKSGGDKDVLFFENSIPDNEVELFVLSLNLFDRIRLINAPPVIVTMLREAVLQAWPKGIQKETDDFFGAFEIKLHGNPWIKSNLGSESISRCILLSQVIANFKAMGYKLYASLDMTGGVSNSEMDLETWIFRKITTNYQ